MQFVIKQYHDTLSFLCKKIRLIFLISVTLFLLVSVICTVYFQYHPESAMKLIQTLLLAKGELIQDGAISLPHLFLNNLQAAFLSVVLGFIPFLPLFVLFVNANVMAATLAIAGQNGASIWKVVMFGILPHGIFELFALLLCISLGIYLFKELINRKKEIRFLETLEQIARAFLLVVLPLLIIASLIECYITPLLMGLAL